MKQDLLDTYTKINKSFEKKPELIYHIGIDAGFYSEYNNMILAMIYAYVHEIHFKLYSRFANFGMGGGWDEFFVPFCDSVNGRFHRKHNRRGHTNLRKNRLLKLFFYRKIRPNVLLTQDVWHQFRSEEFANAHYKIPELNISGSLRDACQVFCNLIHQYNEPTQKEIDSLIDSLNLPEHFIGMHIRGGDKFIEAELYGIDPYIEAAELQGEVKHVFVLTDDYRIIESLQSERPQWQIYTLCRLEERGYFHKNSQKKEDLGKRKSHLRLFASTDVLIKSDLFIGTFSANPGMYVGMRKDPSKCIGIDTPEWFLQ